MALEIKNLNDYFLHNDRLDKFIEGFNPDMGDCTALEDSNLSSLLSETDVKQAQFASEVYGIETSLSFPVYTIFDLIADTRNWLAERDKFTTEVIEELDMMKTLRDIATSPIEQVKAKLKTKLDPKFIEAEWQALQEEYQDVPIHIRTAFFIRRAHSGWQEIHAIYPILGQGLEKVAYLIGPYVIKFPFSSQHEEAHTDFEAFLSYPTLYAKTVEFKYKPQIDEVDTIEAQELIATRDGGDAADHLHLCNYHRFGAALQTGFNRNGIAKAFDLG